MEDRVCSFGRRMLCRVLGCAVLCGVVLGGMDLRAQTPEPGLPTLRLSTRLVVLDVVVTDAKGNVVPGLHKDDFTLLEDSKPQPLRSFESWTSRPPVPSAPEQNRLGVSDWGDAPLTLFVLDDLNTPFEEKSYAAAMLKRYLEAQPPMLAAPASLLLVNDGGLHPLMGYTRDRQALLHALADRPASVPDQLAKGQTLELLTESFAVLRQIALAAEGSRAHKSVVWLGRGFPALDRSQLDDPSNAELDSGIRKVTSLLTDARMTLYKVDPITTNARTETTDVGVALDNGAPLGTAGLSDVAEDPLAGSFNFNTFAIDTGGRYFYGSNDLERLIAESLRQGNEYYTLSFAPAAGSDRYHSLRVVLRDPSLHATTRSGFYNDPAAADASNETPATVDLQLAATSPMSYDSVGVSIQQARLGAADHKLTVSFQVQDRGLSWTAAVNGPRSTGRIRVLLVALDGQRRLQFSSAATLHLAVADVGEIAQGVVKTSAAVVTDAHTRFVRLLVQDASGRLGSADVGPAALHGANP